MEIRLSTMCSGGPPRERPRPGRAARAHPDRVRARILIDTQAGTEDPETQGAYEAMADALVHGDEETRSGV